MKDFTKVSSSSGVLTSPADPIVVTFGEPVMTSTIQFELSPAVPFTVTWDASLRAGRQAATYAAAYARATLTHDPFQSGTSYTLHLLPGGQTVSGIPVTEQSFRYIYLPYRRYLPAVAR